MVLGNVCLSLVSLSLSLLVSVSPTTSPSSDFSSFSSSSYSQTLKLSISLSWLVNSPNCVRLPHPLPHSSSSISFFSTCSPNSFRFSHLALTLSSLPFFSTFLSLFGIWDKWGWGLTPPGLGEDFLVFL